MIRRILDKLWDSFRPHPERFRGSADTSYVAAMMLDKSQASIINLAKVKNDEDEARSK
jgi:hypothetical protein